MRWFNRLEQKLERYAIGHLTLVLVVGQSLFFVFGLASQEFLAGIQLVPQKVLEGEFWRIPAFIFAPPVVHPLFFIFAMIVLYLMGTALENNWGVFRYNLFLLIGFGLTVAASFAAPDRPASNLFISGSIFLAFATLYPNYVFHLLLVFPVQVKWLALVTAGFILIEFLSSDWPGRLLIGASVFNYLLFFYNDLRRAIKSGALRATRPPAEGMRDPGTPFHVCAACGITDKTHPKMEFRYCGQCAGGLGYCEEHIHHHEHRTASPTGLPDHAGKA